MDNAAQALIIAGVILLAILIIALGMFIYNKAKGVVEGSLGKLDTIKVSQVNQEYQSYMEKRITGSEVKTFLNIVREKVSELDGGGYSLTINASSVSSTAGNIKRLEAKDAANTEAVDKYSSEVLELSRNIKNNILYKIKEDKRDSKQGGLITEVTIEFAENN